jgi:hypothetical protein
MKIVADSHGSVEGLVAGEQGHRYSGCEEHEDYLDELGEYYFLTEDLSTTLNTYVLTTC